MKSCKRKGSSTRFLRGNRSDLLRFRYGIHRTTHVLVHLTGGSAPVTAGRKRASSHERVYDSLQVRNFSSPNQCRLQTVVYGRVPISEMMTTSDFRRRQPPMAEIIAPPTVKTTIATNPVRTHARFGTRSVVWPIPQDRHTFKA